MSCAIGTPSFVAPVVRRGMVLEWGRPSGWGLHFGTLAKEGRSTFLRSSPRGGAQFPLPRRHLGFPVNLSVR